jgi:hypothetical protein
MMIIGLAISFLVLGYLIGRSVGQSVGYLQGLKGEWNRQEEE